MKTIQDFNNKYLRLIWLATCGKMGYPDPLSKDDKGVPVHTRQYECAVNYAIRERVTEETKYDKAAELGLSNITILPTRSKHERTAVLQHFTVNFRDLTGDNEPVTVSLQYGGRAAKPDVDIAHQTFGQPTILFNRSNIEVVADPYFCMYIDLCRQSVDSPIYLPSQVQKSFGFELELVDAPAKQQKRVIRAIGFDKKTDVPKAVNQDNRYELEAFITNAPATKLKSIAKVCGKDTANMTDHGIRIMLYGLASDPLQQSRLSEAIGDDREAVMTAINFLSGKLQLLEFKKDNQWHLRDHTDASEWAVLNGTVMADLSDDEDVAKQRLCSLIIGNDKSAPRRDILREFRRVMEKNERKTTDRAERRNPMDSDAQAAVRQKIVDAMTDGLIKYYPKGAKWCFTDKPNSNEAVIITMNNAADDQKPFDVLFEYVLSKPSDWLDNKLKLVRDAVVTA